MKSVRSQLEDADLAEVISQLSLESTALQAVQQSFVKTQSLSLFNFL
jgi:flagellar hook-associated protein 3 FlgL